MNIFAFLKSLLSGCPCDNLPIKEKTIFKILLPVISFALKLALHAKSSFTELSRERLVLVKGRG